MLKRLWLVAVLCCIALPAPGQTGSSSQNPPKPQAPPTPLPLIPRSHDERERRYQAQHRMILNVLVLDNSGNPASGLKLNDFTLTDNRVPQKLARFREVNGSVGIAPVHIVLLLDAVNNFGRRAGGGDEIVPAARNVSLGVEAENAVGDGIAVVVVVKKPAVELLFAEGCLNSIEIHRGMIAEAAGLGRISHVPRSRAADRLTSQSPRTVHRRAGRAAPWRADACQGPQDR